MVVFEARDQLGAIVYAPEPAVIPMAVELFEPVEGQEIMEGDELLIRWAGGDGAEIFSTAYAALDGSVLYRDDIDPGETGEFTVPPGQTVAGTAIVGVGALSGDASVIDTLDNDFLTDKSSFIVSRGVYATLEVLPVGGTTVMRTSRTGTGCPYAGDGSWGNARRACILQFAAFGIGFAIWSARAGIETNRLPCMKACMDKTSNGDYCTMYLSVHGWAWKAGCLACPVTTAGYYHFGTCYDTGPVTLTSQKDNRCTHPVRFCAPPAVPYCNCDPKTP